MENLKVDLFEDEVFVFTPKGEVKSLAAGATPLDFAYEVHTEVGHRCVGAKVNGKIVPLHYELQVRRHRRGADLQARARPVARLARRREDDARAQQDQAVVQGRVAPRHRARRPRAAAGAPAQAGPAGAEDRRLAAARRRHPRDGLPQGRRLLHRAGRREDLAQGRRQQGHAAPQGRATPPTASRPPPRRCCRAASAGAGGPRARRPTTASGSRASTTSCSAWPSAAARCRGTRSSATSRSGAASPSTARTAPTRWRCARTPSASPPVSWDGDGQSAFKVELHVDALGPPPAARGPLARLLRAGREHHRGALPRQRPDGAQPLRASRWPTRSR